MEYFIELTVRSYLINSDDAVLRKDYLEERENFLDFIENIHDNGTAYCVMFSLMC